MGKKIAYVIMGGDDYVTESSSSRNNGYAFTHNLQGATFFDSKEKADNCMLVLLFLQKDNLSAFATAPITLIS